MSASQGVEAPGLKEHLAEDGMGCSHCESEPTIGLINVLNVRGARGEPQRQQEAHVPSRTRKSDVEVVVAADEVEDAT
jgi:hypothetical protein